MWAALPDVPFAGVVFTMPCELWPILRQNRHLLDDLPALGAAVIDRWAQERYGVRLLITVVRHTFGRHLNFNPHLHVLVSSGGLSKADGIWVSSLTFDPKALMRRWRYAVITYLREANRRGLLESEATKGELQQLLTIQYERWWNVNVQRCTSKEHFLSYAGRYVRRPPLAQYRIESITDDQISFRTKDHRLKQEVMTRYTPEEFIGLLGEHVHDHYRHAVRHFGLLAPRSKGRTFGAIFAQLGQHRRPKPQHLSWAKSIERSYGINPLVDSTGATMQLSIRHQATATSFNHWQFIG